MDRLVLLRLLTTLHEHTSEALGQILVAPDTPEDENEALTQAVISLGHAERVLDELRTEIDPEGAEIVRRLAN